MESVTNGFWKMKNKKSTRGISLLSKALRLFACCTAVCFVLTVPLFYLLTKYFYAEDIIDIIDITKEQIESIVETGKIKPIEEIKEENQTEVKEEPKKKVKKNNEENK